MGNILDFGNREALEDTIKRTWAEFRDALAGGLFKYNEVDKAKECLFFRVYDDVFQHGMAIQTISISKLKSQRIGRGTILKETETPDHKRFIPNKDYITADNRFSPPGIEWLYLAIGDEDDDIRECARTECKVKKGDRFGFCRFEFNSKYDDCKLVDLTIADNITYNELNNILEDYVQSQINKGIMTGLTLGIIPPTDRSKSIDIIIKWAIYTYSKLLSEQIFVPLVLPDNNNKKIEYAPFQTIAQYYISLGYTGIIYGSTVCPVGKNIVLFDKHMAYPIGDIEITAIS